MLCTHSIEGLEQAGGRAKACGAGGSCGRGSTQLITYTGPNFRNKIFNKFVTAILPLGKLLCGNIRANEHGAKLKGIILTLD